MFRPLNQIIEEVMNAIDTQLQAYAAINESRASILRTKVKRALNQFGALTSEEISTVTGEDYASIQPRTSELHESLEIFDTGQRRFNVSRKKAIVWAMVETDEQRQLAVKQTLKKMKPIGDEKLFGEMARASYAFAAKEEREEAEEFVKALLVWGKDWVKQIRKSKFSANLQQDK